MLNLVQLTQERFEVCEESGPVLVCTDPLTDTVYFANQSSIWAVSDNQKVLFCLKFGLICFQYWTCSLVEECPVGVHFSTELDALFVVFESGDAVVIREGIKEERISISEGILTLQWSPEEDVCVIVTKSSNITLFNPVSPSSVTLFLMFWNQVTLESILDTQLMSDEMSGQLVELMWRGDGQYFAIAFSKSQKMCSNYQILILLCFIVVLQSLKELR